MFPRVAVSLEVLEAFHALSFQGKVNAYDYYNGLVRLSDGGGVIKIKVRAYSHDHILSSHGHYSDLLQGVGSLYTHVPPSSALQEGGESSGSKGHREYG